MLFFECESSVRVLLECLLYGSPWDWPCQCSVCACFLCLSCSLRQKSLALITREEKTSLKDCSVQERSSALTKGLNVCAFLVLFPNQFPNQHLHINLNYQCVQLNSQSQICFACDSSWSVTFWSVSLACLILPILFPHSYKTGVGLTRGCLVAYLPAEVSSYSYITITVRYTYCFA